jgi:hypothetical protein
MVVHGVEEGQEGHDASSRPSCHDVAAATAAAGKHPKTRRSAPKVSPGSGLNSPLNHVSLLKSV